jgi:hypothetical protein
MINFTKGGDIAFIKLGGVLSFSLFLSFVICRFLVNSWVLRLSLTRWPFSSLSLVLGHSLVLHLILDPKFKLCAFGVVNVVIKGEIEKPSGLCFGLFVW